MSVAFALVSKKQNDVFNFAGLSQQMEAFVNTIFDKMQEEKEDLTKESFTAVFNAAVQAVYVEKTGVAKKGKAMSAYNIFYRDYFVQLKEEHGKMEFKEMSKMVSSKWASLTDAEKKKYVDMAKEGSPKAEKKETKAEKKADAKADSSKPKSESKKSEAKPSSKKPTKK